MAVRSSQYGREMDKSPAGKSTMAQHKRAVHKSSTTTRPDKYDKPSFVDRVMLGMMKLGKGKGDKIDKPVKMKLKRRVPMKPMKPKEYLTTTRTKDIESGLKRAGITDKEMARFQRSKKGK